MVNTPLPHSLKSEAKKAAKILREFSIPNAKSGPDSLIPAGILAKAKGLAIITVFKAGFLVTARGGSGIVIAKLDDGGFSLGAGWSAPSAIGMAGLGGGFEIGMEVTDFVIILNTKAAVDAFSKGGNLTLGGNFTIAAGPLGRNIEGDIAVRGTAAIYTYSKTKGIFAGISIEGSALIERKDANRKFYGREIRAIQILNGEVDCPAECEELYSVLKEHQEFAIQAVADMAKKQAIKQKDKLAGMSDYSQYKFTRSASNKSKKSSEDKIPRSHSDWNVSGSSSPVAKMKGSRTASNISARSTQAKESPQHQSPILKHDPWKDIDDLALKKRTTASPSSYSGATASPSSYSGATASPLSYSGATASPLSYSGATASPSSYRGATASPLSYSGATASPLSYSGATASPVSFARKSSLDTFWAVADFTYQAQLGCDLSFFAGDRIKVTTRTRSQQDWWEGIDSAGHQGIFPANYVHIMA